MPSPKLFQVTIATFRSTQYTHLTGSQLIPPKKSEFICSMIPNATWHDHRVHHLWSHLQTHHDHNCQLPESQLHFPVTPISTIFYTRKCILLSQRPAPNLVPIAPLLITIATIFYTYNCIQLSQWPPPIRVPIAPSLITIATSFYSHNCTLLSQWPRLLDSSCTLPNHDGHHFLNSQLHPPICTFPNHNCHLNVIPMTASHWIPVAPSLITIIIIFLKLTIASSNFHLSLSQLPPPWQSWLRWGWRPLCSGRWRIRPRPLA